MKRFVGAVALMLAMIIGFGSPAYAEAPPSNIKTNVVDNSGNLDKSRVDELVKQVQRETGYQLYVYITNDFSGMSGAQWAYQAATNSHLDESKAVLFAVAVKDRKYGSAFPSNSVVSQKGSTMEQAAIPAMKQGQWTNAVEAYTNQLIAVVHKTDAESAQNAGHADAAGGVLLTVLTWILAGLVGIGLIVLAVRFGPRTTRSFLDYLHKEKMTRSDIREFKVSIPAAITKLDESIVSAKDKLSYSVSMYGEALLKDASVAISKAQGFMQDAIKKQELISKNSYGFKGARYLLEDLQEADSLVRNGVQRVNVAEKTITMLDERVSALKVSIAEIEGRAASLQASLSEDEAALAGHREKFDESYLTNLVAAVGKAAKSIASAKRNISAASTALANIQIEQAEAFALDASRSAEDARLDLAGFNNSAQFIAQFAATRHRTIRKFEAELSADTSENAHPSVVELIPAAKAALEEAETVDCFSGNPDKALEKALAPVNEYRSAVASLVMAKDAVKSAKKDAKARIQSMSDWEVSILTNIRDYNVQIAAEDKRGMDEVARIIDVEAKAISDSLDSVPLYDLTGALALAGELDKLNRKAHSLADSTVMKVNDAIEEEERRQAEIRAEKERKKKEKRRREEEEARRRRRNSYSSSSSSAYGAAYGAGYSSGYSGSSYSGGSDFSSSGGSFGGGFDSSGGSF